MRPSPPWKVGPYVSLWHEDSWLVCMNVTVIKLNSFNRVRFLFPLCLVLLRMTHYLCSYRCRDRRSCGQVTVYWTHTWRRRGVITLCWSAYMPFCSQRWKLCKKSYGEGERRVIPCSETLESRSTSWHNWGTANTVVGAVRRSPHSETP
jgi:hypothetical protein